MLKILQISHTHPLRLSHMMMMFFFSHIKCCNSLQVDDQMMMCGSKDCRYQHTHYGFLTGWSSSSSSSLTFWLQLRPHKLMIKQTWLQQLKKMITNKAHMNHPSTQIILLQFTGVMILTMRRRRRRGGGGGRRRREEPHLQCSVERVWPQASLQGLTGEAQNQGSPY